MSAHAYKYWAFISYSHQDRAWGEWHGSLALTAGEDGTAKIWDAHEAALLDTVARQNGAIRDGFAVLSPDDGELLTGGTDDGARL